MCGLKRYMRKHAGRGTRVGSGGRDEERHGDDTMRGRSSAGSRTRIRSRGRPGRPRKVPRAAGRDSEEPPVHCDMTRIGCSNSSNSRSSRQSSATRELKSLCRQLEVPRSKTQVDVAARLPLVRV